jgi:anti-anti-sigma factor
MARSAKSDKNVKIRELTVPAGEGQLGRVRDFVVEACDEAAFSDRETSNTKLAVDEACTNIITHAYGGTGQGDIKVRIQIEPGNLQISLHDKGERFDFASIQNPDLEEYVETGRKGGLGIYLINRLMDGVEYHADDAGNELVLTKRSQSAISRGLIPETMPFRSTLRFKFMLRASGGLLLLVAAIWAFVFFGQTRDISTQRTTQWMEKRRLAENLSNRSKDVLLRPDEFSVEQTNLSSYLSKLQESRQDLAYVRVTDPSGQIVSSGIIEEIFAPYVEPPNAVVLTQDDKVVWRATKLAGRDVRDIDFAVRVTNPDTGQPVNLGSVHLGVYEDAIGASIEDPRLTVTLILLAVFLIGLLLIMGLVSVFVKPIQVLTDGVRAIGDGTLDTKLDVEGPAEIGAIASVFNEITNKFKKAQESVLEQEKMQKEMEVAKEIQHSLLPRQTPKVSGYDIAPLYQAAAEVGGDYYDFVDVDDDTIGVVVADVSGKGVPGSLVMTMIRTALRMEARGNKHASDVMSKMNTFVTDDMKKGMFVTMFYVILDSKNRTISYASAGHNPMVLYRHETKETFFLNPKGFPVGISLPDEELFRKSISLEKIKLKKDDMLLIYTDGVTEAMNERREQFGEDRLLTTIKQFGHLHPEDFIATLEREIKKFTGGHPQNDDITVVAVKEKLTADEVLFGIRKKLIDLVEVQGLSVKEACRQMKVSPATFYRYKKRLEVMGERGLKNKVLREDTQLKRVSLEARKEILEIIRQHPEYGAKRITTEYNAGQQEAKKITERMVYDELKRLNLNTKELRLDYLRRNRLLEKEMLEGAEPRTGKDIVEDLLKEIAGVETVGEKETVGEDAAAEGTEIGSDRGDLALEFEGIEDVGLSVFDSPSGVATIQVNGHLDSVTSTSLEQLLKRLISEGKVRFIVDLGDVTYISSGGWGIFTGEVRHLRESGGDVVLVNMSSEVYDVYELLGFNEVLKACASREEGHAYFDLPPDERLAVASQPSAAPGPSEAPTADTGDADVFTFKDEVSGEAYVPEWESLQIEATTVGAEGDIAVLSLRGIIDTVSAESLRTALGRIISGGILKLVIDMSQVEYVSSGGWGTFTERLREVRRNQGDIKLFGMDPDVYYVFTMLGFNIVLSSFDILTEAIEAFEQGVVPPGSAEQVDESSAARDDAVESDGVVSQPPSETKESPPSPVEEGAFEIDLSSREVGVDVRWENTGEGVVIAHLAGFIEAAAVEVLSTGLLEKLIDRPRAVLFDLENVEYISSTGWGQFASCYEAVREWNGIVALYGLNPDLHDLYTCLEFNAFIKDYPDRVAAVEAAIQTPIAPSETPPEPAPHTEQAPETQDAPGPSARGTTDEIEGRDEGGVLSVDDVLGGDDADSGGTPPPLPPTPTGPSGEPQRWPGEPAPEEPLTERPVSDEPAVEGETPMPIETTSKSEKASAPLHEEPDRVQTELDRRFIDMNQHADVVDVNSAVSDKNKSNDKRLRDIGWEAYGEKLKRRNEPRRKKKKD